MKKFPSKAEQRQQLAHEVEEFLRAGGEIREVPRGVSGRDPETPPTAWHLPRLFEQRPQEQRTDVTDVVATLEARRQAMKKPPRPKPRRPRKVVMYDDFGEPVREVWRED